MEEDNSTRNSIELPQPRIPKIDEVWQCQCPWLSAKITRVETDEPVLVRYDLHNVSCTYIKKNQQTSLENFLSNYKPPAYANNV